jgi:hypothetical protein
MRCLTMKHESPFTPEPAASGSGSLKFLTRQRALPRDTRRSMCEGFQVKTCVAGEKAARRARNRNRPRSHLVLRTKLDGTMRHERLSARKRRASSVISRERVGDNRPKGLDLAFFREAKRAVISSRRRCGRAGARRRYEPRRRSDSRICRRRIGSRTYRSRATTFATDRTKRSRNGIKVIPGVVVVAN